MAVSNLIKINNAVAVGDVRERIMAAFRRSATADASALSVAADCSTVKLSGNVHGRHERQVAERTEWAAPGVFFVDDNIVVLEENNSRAGLTLPSDLARKICSSKAKVSCMLTRRSLRRALLPTKA